MARDLVPNLPALNYPPISRLQPGGEKEERLNEQLAHTVLKVYLANHGRVKDR